MRSNKILATSRWLARAAAVVAMACVWVGQSLAALVPIAPPPSVIQGALTSTSVAYLFPEQEVTLPFPLFVDISIPGLYNKNTSLTAGTVPAGTRVKSFMIHHDSYPTFSTVQGFAISPTNILGIITSDAGLDATDALLGNPGTLYPTGLAFRGMELHYPITPDVLYWDNNTIFISFVSNTLAVMDQFRVLTIVPEPAAWLSLALGAMLLLPFGVARRRRTTASSR
jgi:hypothetical protein